MTTTQKNLGSQWSKKHREYQKTDWINKPSIFAETAIEFFPKTGKVLELGAGQGQDSRFFAHKGYTVVSTDKSNDALKINRTNLLSDLSSNVSIEPLDLTKKFLYGDATYEVAYAHLSLHYFDTQTTRQIFSELYRVLKPDGILALLVNSTNDPEYATGKKLEDDFFEIEGKDKRFFSVATVRDYTNQFVPILADNQGETYKDSEKGIHNLIRFVGEKK